MIEAGSGLARHLGALVPAPQRDRRGRVPQGDEFGGEIGGERTTLQRQAAHRASREKGEIFRIDRRQMALGFDMEAHRAGDVLAEILAEPVAPPRFVTIVDAALGGAGSEIMDEMADIVEQRGGDERRAGAARLGELRALQRVGELCHVLVAVIGTAALVENGANPVDRVGRFRNSAHQTILSPWRQVWRATGMSARSATRVRSPRFPAAISPRSPSPRTFAGFNDTLATASGNDKRKCACRRNAECRRLQGT